MFQTDQATAVLSLPAPAAAGTPGYFTNGNPVTGIAPTILDADFVNMVMMELLNVVTAAGLTPSKTTNNQVLAAIRSLGATNAFGTPSSNVKFAGGLILQSGTIATSASADVAVVFPTAFLVAAPQVIVSAQSTTAGVMAGWNTPTINGFNVNAWTATATRVVATVSWFAIGH